MTVLRDQQQRKRPITDAVLSAEARYRKARKKITTLTEEIGRLRYQAVSCEDDESVRQAVEPFIEILEVDITRHRKELALLESDYESSKEIIRQKIQEKLTLHEGFLHFLSGFATTTTSTDRSCREDSSTKNEEKASCCCRRRHHDTHPTACHLPMLNLGFETTSSIKKRIADFAGVPRGFALGDLRESSVTLMMRGSSKDRHGSKSQIPPTHPDHQC